MASVATDPALKSVGSHSISMDYGQKLSKEECYPVMTAKWRGNAVQVRLSAYRYVYSDGDWSQWRVYVRSDGLTDTARAALNAACVPLVLAWLDNGLGTDDDPDNFYNASRQLAFFYMIRRAIADEKYNADNAAGLIARYGHELLDDNRELLTDAVKHLAAFLADLDTSPVR